MLRLAMSTPISVLRLGADVARRLGDAPADAGRVHSVFDRAVNLTWHDGGLITLQGRGRLIAPFAAELSRLPRSAALRAGARVSRHADMIALDGVTLEWAGARTADNVMPESARPPSPALGGVLAAAEAEQAPALSSRIGLSGQSRLASGLRRRDARELIAGARLLVGLGEGLTPAGDDCLVGALAVVHRFARSWLAEHPEIEASLGTTVATATTTIAREFLGHALAGRFAETLIELLTAESEGAIARAATLLRRTGATSGADTVAGVRLALTALAAS